MNYNIIIFINYKYLIKKNIIFIYYINIIYYIIYILLLILFIIYISLYSLSPFLFNKDKSEIKKNQHFFNKNLKLIYNKLYINYLYNLYFKNI